LRRILILREIIAPSTSACALRFRRDKRAARASESRESPENPHQKNL